MNPWLTGYWTDWSHQTVDMGQVMGDNCSVSVSSQAEAGGFHGMVTLVTPGNGYTGGTGTRHTEGQISFIIWGKDMHFKTQFCVKMYYLPGK